MIIVQASQLNPNDIHQIWLQLHYNLVSVIIFTIVIFGSTVYIMARPRSIFLVDYSCYRPPSHLQFKFQRFMENSKLIGVFDESSLEFKRKIFERSGIGEETYAPEALHFVPPRPSMAKAREEAEQVMFGALDNLFANTNVKAKDIGILLVNCSVFNPTPSLSAMIVNNLLSSAYYLQLTVFSLAYYLQLTLQLIAFSLLFRLLPSAYSLQLTVPKMQPSGMEL
nr:3-ketoacyl-coa synthase 4 [Quercus suber]